MDTLRRNPFWLALLPTAVCLSDVGLTLHGQSAEYWRGDGALIHQDALSGADLPEDEDSRTYLLSGTDHLGAVQGPSTRASASAAPEAPSQRRSAGGSA